MWTHGQPSDRAADHLKALMPVSMSTVVYVSCRLPRSPTPIHGPITISHLVKYFNADPHADLAGIVREEFGCACGFHDRAGPLADDQELCDDEELCDDDD
jgi:hypothetical protein